MEAHKDPEATNTMGPRTNAGICLGPTVNVRGTTNAHDAKTGAIKKSCILGVLSTPGNAIEHTSETGNRDNQKGHKEHLKFSNRHREACTWDNGECNKVLQTVQISSSIPDMHLLVPVTLPGMDLV